MIFWFEARTRAAFLKNTDPRRLGRTRKPWFVIGGELYEAIETIDLLLDNFVVVDPEMTEMIVKPIFCGIIEFLPQSTFLFPRNVRLNWIANA